MCPIYPKNSSGDIKLEQKPVNYNLPMHPMPSIQVPSGSLPVASGSLPVPALYPNKKIFKEINPNIAIGEMYYIIF